MLLPNVVMIQHLLSCIPNEADTPAAAMENQVPQDVAKERFNRLLALVQQEGRRRSSRFEGSVQEVLVEEESKEKGIFTGRTEYNLLVHFPGMNPSLANMSESQETTS